MLKFQLTLDLNSNIWTNSMPNITLCPNSNYLLLKISCNLQWTLHLWTMDPIQCHKWTKTVNSILNLTHTPSNNISFKWIKWCSNKWANKSLILWILHHKCFLNQNPKPWTIKLNSNINSNNKLLSISIYPQLIMLCNKSKSPNQSSKHSLKVITWSSVFLFNNSQQWKLLHLHTRLILIASSRVFQTQIISPQNKAWNLLNNSRNFST